MLNVRKKYKPRYHDVYVVKSSSTAGKGRNCMKLLIDSTFGHHYVALRCKEKMKPHYLFYLLQTRRMQDSNFQIKHRSVHTAKFKSCDELEKFDSVGY